MNKQIEAINRFLDLENQEKKDKELLRQLYKEILGFEYRYIFANPIDIFVDIAWFLEKAYYEVYALNTEVWYYEIISKVGLDRIRNSRNIKRL